MSTSGTSSAMQVDTPSAAAASSSAAASSAAAAAASPAAAAASSSSSSSSASSSSQPPLLLLRETRFFHRSPRVFVDDLVNALGDYVGFACDELEKAAVAQVVKKPARAQEVARAVDAMYQAIDARLAQETRALEDRVYSGDEGQAVLRIGKHVITPAEMANQQHAAVLGGADDEASTAAFATSTSSASAASAAASSADAQLSATLAALQQRVASAAALNRALRAELAKHQADEEAYARHEEELLGGGNGKKQAAIEAALVQQAAALQTNVARLQTVHDAVANQFVATFGADSAEGLKGAGAARTTTRHQQQQADDGQGAGSGGEVTRQINLAAQMGDVTQMFGLQPTTAAAATATTPAAAAAAAAASMNIDQDAASML